MCRDAARIFFKQWRLRKIGPKSIMGRDFSKNRANLTKMKENVILGRGVLPLAGPLMCDVYSYARNAGQISD